MLERMWRKGNPLALLVEMWTGTATLENFVEVPKELKIELPYDPAIALLGIYPKDTDAVKLRDTCTPMFIAAMSKNSQTVEGASVSIERWMDKEDVVYVYNGILVIRNDKYPPFPSTWMELEGIMLSEVSQSEKDKQCMFSLIGEYK